ncbi:hypothetical protein E5Q_00283 [Mixia osmundae IAM 14324]|uniref:Uncharacterized protein n=1 Tax=Mixia osmundae (strain CBS 9802 / IAM 14324 / JCM 22182 / KY 12970) TaxID=764103 RepID=G7DST1_MIXOS|nr:hypothetical protein E5Q_00283 [Mixia osmundae IAM 14324]
MYCTRWLQASQTAKRMLSTNCVVMKEPVWATDPYLAMLSSPLRRCKISLRIMPRDMLISLSVAKAPDSLASTSPIDNRPPKLHIVPNKLGHPYYDPGHLGPSSYILCSRPFLNAVLARPQEAKRLSYGAELTSTLPLRLTHELRVRVEQELTQLWRRHRASPHKATQRPAWLLRRLSQAEAGHIATRLPQESPDDMAALISLDSSDLRTHFGAHMDADAYSSLRPTRAATELPRRRLPIYDLGGLFTERFAGSPGADVFNSEAQSVQRTISRRLAAIEEGLISRNVLSRKPSHRLTSVYALASHQTELVPLLVALWRCRLWEGEGWQSGDGFGIEKARFDLVVPASNS